MVMVMEGAGAVEEAAAAATVDVVEGEDSGEEAEVSVEDGKGRSHALGGSSAFKGRSLGLERAICSKNRSYCYDIYDLQIWR